GRTSPGGIRTSSGLAQFEQYFMRRWTAASGGEFEQGGKGLLELRQAFLLQTLADDVEVDAEGGERRVLRPRRIEVAPERVADLTMVAQGREGGVGQGVDRVGADQRFDVEQVAVGRVLGAGARPQHVLRSCAGGAQDVEARAMEALEIALVGALGGGDRAAPAQREGVAAELLRSEAR